MLALLLVAQAATASPAPVSALDAERAFIRDAQIEGQWTAFRKWAADDAVLFVPQTVNAKEYLAPLKDPPAAIAWWPTASYVSCDGSYAVNTGPWVNGGGRALGYFSTVWRKTGDSWRWIYDGGDKVEALRPTRAGVKPTVAICTGKPAGAADLGASAAKSAKSTSGHSADGTLAWSWTVGPKGERRFVAQLWNGKSFDIVIDDRVEASD